VVSNSNGNCKELLADMGLADFFDVIVDSAIVGVEKPHPDVFAHALEPLGIRPEEAVMVGDFYCIDVMGARRAGLGAVLYDPLHSYWAKDVPCISRLSQLPRYLEGKVSPAVAFPSPNP
jgi:putative hydrolase of the HAD superfamily